MLSPNDVVKELDRYIIGQKDAKKAVALALRSRWRRQQLESPLKEDVMPKNIILIGPTGVGKTEIARRLAKLVNSPFIKIEASKFTEVGYVGKDVESIIRDLTRIAVNMLKNKEEKRVKKEANFRAEEQVINALLKNDKFAETSRETLLLKLRNNVLGNENIIINVSETRGPKLEVLSFPGMEGMGENMKDMLDSIMPNTPKQRRKKTMTVNKAMEVIVNDETNRMIDMDKIKSGALDNVQNNGIVFIDEIDKIATRSSNSGIDISREGVQRDILPLVEGTDVNTKYGMVKTDHILFIAAGAFHVSKPSDLMPELQGRFPIRVELQSLTSDDFKKILVEPDNSLVKQYTALLKTEGVDVVFKDDSINELSNVAVEINDKTENIGARRLHTVMEKLLDEVSFNASEMNGQKVEVNQAYVEKRLGELVKDRDLSKYIL